MSIAREVATKYAESIKAELETSWPIISLTDSQLKLVRNVVIEAIQDYEERKHESDT